ncbi:MAG TPA: DUF58 domain-containing protein [Anaerolineales bacterium]|nr:DUF58 domain-containing protein [Anaerolineales bacterium]
MNDKTITVGLTILLLLIAMLLTRNGDIAWMIMPFLAYLGVGILQTPSLESLSFSAKRTLEQTRTNGVLSIAVNVAIQNKAPETVNLFIQETVQPGMKITEGELSQWVTLQPGESTALNYSFTAARGDFSWESVQITACDPLGLLETEMALPDSTMIQVRPQIKKFKAISLRPHNTVHSPGSIPARLGGSGTDFFGVREYHPGDSLRTLDWRLTARHPRKFFTKEFEQEEIAEIGLILDARQSTDVRIGEESLFEHSVGAAASLAEMFLHQGHRVSLLVFGETMLHTFPGYGKTQLHRILNCLSKAKVETVSHGLANFAFLPLRMFPSHALMIIISSLTATDRSFFQRLRAYGYQAFLVSPDPLDFAAPVLPQDITNRLAIRATRIERQLWLNEIARLHIPVIDWQVSQPLFPLVRNVLTRSRGQREV